MAVTRINNNQVTSAAVGNVAAGINAAVKIQAYSVVSQNLANDIVIGNSLSVTGNLYTANISTDNYQWANGVPINFSSLTYDNANVAAYLPSYNGSLNPSEILTDNYYWANGAPVIFGNTLSGAYMGDQQFYGDGSNSTFSLNYTSTAGAMLVAINGVTQYPGVAYTSGGNTITFTTTPLNTDFVDIRFFGQGTGNGTGNYGNANVAVFLASGNVGNILAGNILTNNYLWANGVPINFGNTLTGMFIDDQQFWGTTSPVYVMNQANADPTTMVVSINGVVQSPGVAYTTGNGFITFTNPVGTGDYVDIRYMGSTSQANLIAGNVFSNNYYWANGAPYVNGNVTVVNGIILGDQQITADGNSVYSLDANTSASTVVVSINGVVQLPYVAYQTFSNVISFTAPVTTGDVIDIRYFGDANSLVQYGDANVISLLGNLTTDINTTGNVTANNFFGNSVVTVGNISGNYIFGNGAFLTGVQTSGNGTPTFLRVQQDGGFGQLITQIPQAVEFPYVEASSGNAIAYSNGTFTLQPGFSYQLRGTVGGYGWQEAAPPYVRYQWIDITNGIDLGTIARIDGATQPTTDFSGSAGGTAESIITPTAPTDVQLVLIDDGYGDIYFTIGGENQGQAFAEIIALTGGSGGGPGNYGDANVEALLASGTVGNVLAANLVVTTGNIYLGGTPLTRTLTVGRAVTPVTVPLATNNSLNVLTVNSGNVVVYTT